MLNVRAFQLQHLAWIQGIYFTLTGLWPLVHIESFMFISGPKYEVWLVKTLGVLIATIGFVLMHAAFRKEVTSSIRLLALLSAAGLTAVDIVYVALEVISPIYLLDAAAEGVLIGLWIGSSAQANKSNEGEPFPSSNEKFQNV